VFKDTSMVLSSMISSIRVHDKGNPVVRRARKATGLLETAGLPKGTRIQ
jgi:hypothetical protein